MVVSQYRYDERCKYEASEGVSPGAVAVGISPGFALAPMEDPPRADSVIPAQRRFGHGCPNAVGSAG